MEYAGEIITYSDFLQRTQEYSKEGLKHFYFMSLKKDEVMIILIPSLTNYYYNTKKKKKKKKKKNKKKNKNKNKNKI